MRKTFMGVQLRRLREERGLTQVALALRAWVSRVGRSSLTVCVHGLAQAPGCPDELALQGVFEMVAVNAHGRPTAIAHTYLNTPPHPFRQETP